MLKLQTIDRLDAVADSNLVLGGLDPRAEAQAVQDLLRKIANENGIASSESAETVTLSLFGGTLSVGAADLGTKIVITAEDDTGLFRLQQIVLGLSSHHNVALAPEWSRSWPDRHPPNLKVAQVVHVEQVSPGFRRVRLRSDGFRDLEGGALHVRLLIPPRDRAPIWPWLDDNGRQIWPEGDDALHRPVYTFRMIDPAAGIGDVDIFLHDGGRVTEWSETAAPGEVIGTMGPIGKSLPACDWVALFGDETALPAIARNLETLPADTRGKAFVHLQDLRDRQDLTAPAGVEVEWITGEGEPLLDAMRGLKIPETSRFIWFASEKSQCQTVRAYLRDDLGMTRDETHVTAYWTRATTATD